MTPNLIVILGPTASGKTKLAANLAHTLHTQIISADSRQVYTGMDIGTGKDLAAYCINEHTIQTHLIDIVDAGEKYHVNQFKNDFIQAFNSITQQQQMPILCGGTGLYIDAILNNYEYTQVPINPNQRELLTSKNKLELEHLFNALPLTDYTSKADTSTHKRLIRAIEISTYLKSNTFKPQPFPTITPIIFGLSTPLVLRRKNIETRLKERLKNGLLEEVEILLKTIPRERLIYYGLEYKFVTQYLIGHLTLSQMNTQLLTAIQQYAKRQMTYFRKMERDGKHIHWVDATQSLAVQLNTVVNILNNSSNNSFK
jgi:tRNA dimethylallyltransferase